MANTSSSDSTRILLKCFCGCSELTQDEVKNITTMNAARIVENGMAKRLFESFLKLGRPNDRSRVQDEIDSYNLCKRLRSDVSYRTDENFERLCELCPNYKWECELQQHIEKLNAATDDDDGGGGDGGVEEFEQFLTELMSENIRNIESHQDYDRFHKTLLDKLVKSRLFSTGDTK